MNNHFIVDRQDKFQHAEYSGDVPLSNESQTFEDVFSLKVKNTGGSALVVKSKNAALSKSIAASEEYLISAPYPYLLDITVDATGTTAVVEYLRPDNKDC